MPSVSFKCYTYSRAYELMTCQELNCLNVRISVRNFVHKDTRKVLEQCTGFRPADSYNDMKLGKWFTVEDGCWPDFVSSRSFQRDVHGDDDGWKAKRQYVPDIWIKPEDSFVVT